MNMFISLINFFVLFVLSTSTDAATSPTQKCIDGHKLCFGTPSECVTSPEFNCQILIQISAKANTTDGLDVDIYGKGSPATYFALGFVGVRGMSGSTVVHCDYLEDSSVIIGEGYTEGYSFKILPLGTLTTVSRGEVNDGIVHCYWNQKSNGIAGESDINYNIHNMYYVQIASGPLTGQRVRRHSIRSITDSQVKLTSVGVVKTSKTIDLPIRVHGSLMTISWLCLVSIAMIIARYHKNSWGNTKLCGVNVWFALHRSLMLAALTSAIVGMVTIFLHVGGWRADSPHQYLGVCANTFMILQPLGALFRPAPDHPKRIFFNVGHTLGGNIGHILAIITIFFVTKLSITLSKGFYIVLIVFVGVYLTTHLILQFHPQLLSTLNVIEVTDMDDLKNGTNNSPDDPVRETFERSKKRVLTIFIALVIIITIALTTLINMGSP